MNPIVPVQRAMSRFCSMLVAAVPPVGPEFPDDI